MAWFFDIFFFRFMTTCSSRLPAAVEPLTWSWAAVGRYRLPAGTPVRWAVTHHRRSGLVLRSGTCHDVKGPASLVLKIKLTPFCREIACGLATQLARTKSEEGKTNTSSKSLGCFSRTAFGKSIGQLKVIRSPLHQ